MVFTNGRKKYGTASSGGEIFGVPLTLTGVGRGMGRGGP